MIVDHAEQDWHMLLCDIYIFDMMVKIILSIVELV